MAFALALLGAPLPSQAFGVEPGSQANRLYVVISHPETDPNAPFLDVSIPMEEPAFITQPTPVYLPVGVSQDGGRVAGFEFDVDASAPLGTSGTLVVTVTGTLRERRLELPRDVPLEVVASAPPLQGMIVGNVTGLGTLDTDGDGTPDLQEIANGTDPFAAESGGAPGSSPQPPEVPALGPLGTGLLGLALAGAALALLAPLRGRSLAGDARDPP